jgi:hypothetical protein
MPAATPAKPPGEDGQPGPPAPAGSAEVAAGADPGGYPADDPPDEADNEYEPL